MGSRAVPSRHDLSLAAIAAVLAAATAIGALSPVGMTVALGVGSVLAAGSVGYALFYRPPTDPE
jgi:hypothetical protein